MLGTTGHFFKKAIGWTPSTLNRPSLESCDIAVLFGWNWVDAYGIQLILTKNENRIFYRSRYANSNWFDWVEIAQFGRVFIPLVENISDLKYKSGKFIYSSKNNECPIVSGNTCFVETTSNGTYTTIEVWHIANPQDRYIGNIDTNGAVQTWYKYTMTTV